MQSTQALTPAELSLREREFFEHGYLVLPGLVDARALNELNERIVSEYERVRSEGMPFAGGGARSGHLNCFPGRDSRFVYDTLAEQGVFELVRSLATEPCRQPNIGCNFNLPGSSEQNDHVDGDPERPFLVVNVAAVDTNLENGAMEILERTQHSREEYWKLLLRRPQRKRVQLAQGDVLVRTSTLWHRGMPNRSARPRVMLAFTWEDGGNLAVDPYAVHDGRIKFLPNRYGTDWRSRVREEAFSVAPRVGTAYLALRSFFARDGRLSR